MSFTEVTEVIKHWWEMNFNLNIVALLDYFNIIQSVKYSVCLHTSKKLEDLFLHLKEKVIEKTKLFFSQKMKKPDQITFF